jgi:hypothetical protein
MKTQILTIAGLALLLVPAAGAQTKVTGKQNCPKPDVAGTADAGDRPGHTMQLQKMTCTWTDPMEMAGMKSKDGTSVSFAEMSATRSSGTGTYTGNMENGDKFFVSFHDSAVVKNGIPVTPIHGTWSYTGGTGKLKGISGKGTYTVTPNADGSAVVEVEGDYAIAPASGPKPYETKMKPAK